jgi:hypothetical protein
LGTGGCLLAGSGFPCRDSFVSVCALKVFSPPAFAFFRRAEHLETGRRIPLFIISLFESDVIIEDTADVTDRWAIVRNYPAESGAPGETQTRANHPASHEMLSWPEGMSDGIAAAHFVCSELK